MDCLSAGYYGVGELLIGKMDLCMIRADFSYQSTLGFQPPKTRYVAAQQLMLQDLRVVKKYNKVLHQEHHHLRLGTQSLSDSLHHIIWNMKH
jgi:hypothetical protein